VFRQQNKFGEGMPPKFDTSRRQPFKRAFAKILRTNATDAERILWSLLRGKQLGALRFRRQQPIGPYVVDFFCPLAKLIVELDGDHHGADAAFAYDEARSRFLVERGYRVLRFWNNDVRNDRERVLETIHRALQPSP
jgi:very-short-patch-repair endonuclease